MEEKPCCAAGAARMTKQIQISGSDVGIISLDMIMDMVKSMRLLDDSDIEKELLKQVKIYNYVPSSAYQAYQKGLLDEYNRRKNNDH